MGLKTLNQVDITDGTVQLVDGTSSPPLTSPSFYITPRYASYREKPLFDIYTLIIIQTTPTTFISEDQISSSYRSRHRTPMIRCGGRNGRRCWRLGPSACLRF